MAEEGMAEATWTEAKAHPYIVGGAVVALVGILWFFSSKSPAQTPQHFSFSYGPSDAQIQAGTALAIAQQNDQTSLGLAKIQADTTAGTAQDYYTYLATASNNNLALGTIQSNNQLSLGTTKVLADDTTAAAIASYANNTQVTINAQDNATAERLASLQSATRTNLAMQDAALELYGSAPVGASILSAGRGF